MIESSLHSSQGNSDSALTKRTKGSFYRPELDLLRFGAFSLVFIHHGFALTAPIKLSGVTAAVIGVVRYASGYGLCLFFLLSSYLITEIMLRERGSTGTIHIKAFYIRRVLRIWPLYFAFLIFGFLAGQFIPFFHITPKYVLQYVFLLGNNAFYHQITGNPIGPLWSISVEEQFYLCWPFLAQRFGRKGLLFVSMALIPIAILWSSWLTAHAAQPGFAIWTSSITEFECFAAGALLAIALHKKSWRIGLLSRFALVVSGFACWALSDGLFHFKRGELIVDRQQLPHLLGFQLIVAGCALLFLSVLGLPLRPWSKPFTYLGRISYGLYVYHILAYYFASHLLQKTGALERLPTSTGDAAIAILAFAMTVCFASLSYRYFETTFLRFKDRFTFVRTHIPDRSSGIGA